MHASLMLAERITFEKTTLGHLALIPTTLDVHIYAARVFSSRAVDMSTINVYRTLRNTEQSRSFPRK